MEQCITTLREEMVKLLINEITLKILNHILDNNQTGNTLSITKLGLTRKQFYTKLNELSTKGIIKKEKGKYYLTTFGKIVNDLTSEYKNKLDLMIEDCWKFKAIDLLDISDEMNNDEKNKIKEHLFKFVNQNDKQKERKDINSSNEKLILPYIEYIQNRNTPSKN